MSNYSQFKTLRVSEFQFLRKTILFRYCVDILVYGANGKLEIENKKK